MKRNYIIWLKKHKLTHIDIKQKQEKERFNNRWIRNLLRTEVESTDLGGGRGCFVGATMGWAASVFPLMVAIIIKWIESVTERRRNENWEVMKMVNCEEGLVGLKWNDGTN